MAIKIYASALLSVLGAITVSCQGEHDPYRGRHGGKSSSGNFASVDFEAANSQTEENSLSLAEGGAAAAVAAYKISVTCDDVTPLEVDAAPFDLPLGARNCIAKLKSIQIGDRIYVEAAGGAGFKNYAVNEIGQFVNDKDANDKLYVRVRKQLPSPLTADSAVQYDYSNIRSFETIEGTREGMTNNLVTGGDSAPQIKLTAAQLQINGLSLTLACTDAAGFTSATLADMKCAGANVSSMKIAVSPRSSDAAPTALELKEILNTGKLAKDLKPEFNAADKTLKVQFANLKDSKYYLLVAANGNSYTYGFVKMSGGTIAGASDCKTRDAAAKFTLKEVDAVTGLGHWIENGNCNIWLRPTLEKVVASKRFTICPAAKTGQPAGKILLPYGADMKAVYDKNIKEFAFGAAPKLGDQNTTFWMAGGRVFDMATGKFRELKDIKQNEQHSILCFIKGE